MASIKSGKYFCGKVTSPNRDTPASGWRRERRVAMDTKSGRK
jgi:hypothetical protein